MFATTSPQPERKRRVAVRSVCAVATVLALSTLPHVGAAPARAAGEAQAGREVAARVCTRCHRLPDGTGGGEARPLTAYRSQQPFSATGLRKLVGSWPHAGNVKLPPDPAYADLAAYLNTLDAPAGRGTDTGTAGTKNTRRPRAEGRRPDQTSQGDNRRQPRERRSEGYEMEERYEHEEYEEDEDDEYFEYE